MLAAKIAKEEWEQIVNKNRIPAALRKKVRQKLGRWKLVRDGTGEEESNILWGKEVTKKLWKLKATESVNYKKDTKRMFWRQEGGDVRGKR